MYRIEYLASADRDIKKLDPGVRKRVLLDIEKLAGNPRPVGVKKLSGNEDLYRVKAGPGKNYRVLYEIRDDVLLVLVVKVGDRKDVYRN